MLLSVKQVRKRMHQNFKKILWEDLDYKFILYIMSIYNHNSYIGRRTIEYYHQ